MRDPERLTVWHAAMTMVERVYAATEQLPRSEAFGLSAQMRRSAVSVPSNIAEGCGRRSKREFAQFLAIATGSLYEVRTQMLLATRIGLIADDQELRQSIEAVKGQLVTLRSMVENDLGHH